MNNAINNQRPLVAILRGVQPDEVADVAHAIIEAGITILEVTMNSPHPLESIKRMAKAVGSKANIGAGTVIEPDDVKAIFDVGGQLIISPNMDPEVISQTKALSMQSYPGCQTATECFSALKAGADVLKIFPSSTIGPSGIKALRATLPKETQIYAVGGVNVRNMADYTKVGVNGFGIGSALYAPGKSLETIHKSALEFVKSWDALQLTG